MAGIDGREYQHSTADFTVHGTGSNFTFDTFRGYSYKVSAMKEAVRAKGKNVGHTVKDEDTGGAEMTVLQSEWKTFRAWYAENFPGVLLGLARFDATVSYGNDPSDLMTDKLEGLMFQEDGRSVSPDQNALEVKLPLFILHVHPHGGDFI